MKTIATLMCIAVSVSAHRLHQHASGVDKDDIMQNQASHFRKPWPQGVIDNADGDSEMLDMFNKPLSRKKEKVIVHETFPWTLDHEMK